MKFTLPAATLSLGLILGATGAPSYASTTANPHLSPRMHLSPGITKARAVALALKAQPGRIVASELEAEKGGSGLRYSFDVKVGAATHEVGVDARTGAILENRVEGKNPD